GFSPGPLQTLVISHAVRFGWRAGASTAFAPLVSDIVIVALTVGVIGLVPHLALDVISVVGAAVVTYLAWDTWKASHIAYHVPSQIVLAVGDGGSGLNSRARGEDQFPGTTLWRAVVVNFFNPHAWLFWAVVGAPMTIRASTGHLAEGIIFVAAFYMSLVGSKVLLSILAAHGVKWLGSIFQKWVLRGAAIGLAVVAMVLLANGVLGLIR
ncbi:MAG: LysE family translocator, partial [Sulfobacillus sp.]